jgi:formate dehydrogenase maturation protein FdhE
MGEGLENKKETKDEERKRKEKNKRKKKSDMCDRTYHCADTCSNCNTNLKLMLTNKDNKFKIVEG